MKKLVYLFIIGGLGFVGYHVAYEPPELKEMNALFSTRPTTNVFVDGFEKAKSYKDLFADDYSRWHQIVIQNNTRAIRRPVKHCLISSYNCQIDKSAGNTIELSEDLKYSGRYSLKFHAEPFDTKFFGDSKAAIRRQLFNFKKDDEIYFSGWFYLEDNDNDAEEHHGLSFVAFRSQADSLRYLGEPGRRVNLQGKNVVFSDTDNWLPQPPIFRQDLLDQISMPENQWVNIRIRIRLTDKSNGRMEVWQDGVKILSHSGATLPEGRTKYSILEVGILNNQNEKFAQTLYVDDIWVSPIKFPDGK